MHRFVIGRSQTPIGRETSFLTFSYILIDFKVSHMQKPRAGHFALTIDNKIYVFGGDRVDNFGYDSDSSIECFDQIRGEWTLTGKFSGERLLLLERLESCVKARKFSFFCDGIGQGRI